MKKRTQFKQASIIALCATLLAVIIINVVSAHFSGKIDLTESQRFTLSKSTIDLLKSTDDVVDIKFYLYGDKVPEEYAQLIERAKEMLAEFKDISSNVHYEFIDPLAGQKQEKIPEILGEFLNNGIRYLPVNTSYNSSQKTTMQFIIPGVSISYKGKQKYVEILEYDIHRRYDPITYSYMRMEYNLMKGLKPLIQPKKSHVAVIQGHGELPTPCVLWSIGQIGEVMEDFYSVELATIGGRINSLRRTTNSDTDSTQIKPLGNKYDLLIVAQPTEYLSDTDCYILDQHIMHGGRVLWLIDATTASLDSLANGGVYYAQWNNASRSLHKMFFNYGIRINNNILMDREQFQMIKVKPTGNQPFNLACPYAISINHFNQHPITQHIDSIRVNIASSIETVNPDDGLTKTVLATTSKETKIRTTPGWITLQDGLSRTNPAEYSHQLEPIAILVEGKFKSAFTGKLPISLITEKQFDHKDFSPYTKQIFIADGDVIRNYVDWDRWFPSLHVYQSQPQAKKYLKMHEWFAKDNVIRPTGSDPEFENITFHNAEFIVNCVDYLCDNTDMIELRSKTPQIGKLDLTKTSQEKVRKFYQLTNVGLPLILLAIFGVIITMLRHFRYAKMRKKTTH